MKILKRIFWCFAVIAALLFVSCEMVTGDDEDSENDDTYIEAGSENTKNVTITLPLIEHALDSALRTISDEDVASLQDSIKAYRVKMNSKEISGKPTDTGVTYTATFAVDTTVTVIVECLDEYNKVIVRAEQNHTVVNEGSNDLVFKLKQDGYRILSNLVYDGKILQDGETSAAVMDNKLRWWKLTEPVRVETNNATTANGSLAKVEDSQIRITSYSLYPISNVDVYGNGTKLFTIPNLPALAEQVYELPNGKNNNEYSSYSVQSNDAHYKKIAGGKMPLKLQFYKYGNGIWADLGPLEAREYIAFWTNMAFTFSSKEFETLLNNYKDITGVEFSDDHNNDKNPSGVTKHDLAAGSGPRNTLEERIYRDKTLNIGLIGSADEDDIDSKGGQATPSMLGITPVNLSGAYFLGLGVGIHEFGHTIDYDHLSSFSKDMQTYAGGLSACLIRLGKAPYCDKDLVGYYREDNASKRNLINPSQGMLSKKYNEAEVKRNNPKYYGVHVSGKDSPDGVPYYKPTPGVNPKQQDSWLSTNPEITKISDQYINDFEKAVYNNKTLYSNLYSALEDGGYFQKAKDAGILPEQ